MLPVDTIIVIAEHHLCSIECKSHNLNLMQSFNYETVGD